MLAGAEPILTRPRTRATRAMLAAVVLGALLPAGPTGADPGLTAPGQPPKPGTNTTWTQVPNGSHTVTLITGEPVTWVFSDAFPAMVFWS